VEQPIRWQWCAFPELSATEVYAILAVRSDVFVVEQNSVYLDADGWDLEAQHLVAWSGRDVAGYLRVLPGGTKFMERSIGRVLISQPFRGTGLGRQLMTRALEHLDARFPTAPVRIGAQARLEAFYASLGFAKTSEIYLEDGIPHIEMYRPGPKSGETPG
jgi:ElaA protein